MIKKIFLVLFILFLFPMSAGAEGEFNVSLDVTYRYNNQGVPTVEQKITLINKTPYQYANRYEMVISGDEPSNLKAWDDGGVMKLDIQKNEDFTKLTAYFNKPVAGVDKSYQFYLSFLGKAAIHNGQVWEVNFPKLNNVKLLNDYRLSIIIPKIFGKTAFVSPLPLSNNGEVLVFTKEQGAHLGVAAAFGDFQTYKFDLSYTLERSGTIALPADTAYQRVFYDQIQPPPKNVEIDADGNWLASYTLDPQSKPLNIAASGQAHVLSEATQTMPVPSRKDLTTYIKPTRYWPSTDPAFVKLAKQYQTPRQIYDYVVSTLGYDFTQIGQSNQRKGALAALNDPLQSLCSEFTDLFITMSRAANIPAREINGFAYTTDSRLRPLFLAGIDVLHSWPQYWDEKRQVWISVDPTWGKTTGGIDYFSKLDFNHFAFVTRGITDDTPLAAGFYKLPGDNTRNIKVDFETYKDYQTSPLNVKLNFPWQIWSPTGAIAYLHIDNPNGFAVYGTTIDIKTKNIALENSFVNRTDIIPVFGKIVIPVKIKPDWKINFSSKSLDVVVSGLSKVYNISPVSFLLWHGSVALVISLILLTVGFAAIHIWSISIQRQK